MDKSRLRSDGAERRDALRRRCRGWPRQGLWYVRSGWRDDGVQAWEAGLRWLGERRLTVWLAPLLRGAVALVGWAYRWTGPSRWWVRLPVAAGLALVLVRVLLDGGAEGIAGLVAWEMAGGGLAALPGRVLGEPWPDWALSWHVAVDDRAVWSVVVQVLA